MNAAQAAAAGRSPDGWGRRLYLLAALLGCVLAFAFVQGSTVGQRLELSLQDTVMRALHPAAQPASAALVVEIDEASLQGLRPLLGSWPFSREVYAILLDYLYEHGAHGVLLDLVFADPREGDEALAAALVRHPRTVLVGSTMAFAGGEASQRSALDALAWARAEAGRLPARAAEAALLPAPLLSASLGTGQFGLISASLDSDGLLRRLPLLYQIDACYLPAAALQMLMPGRQPTVLESGNGALQAGSWRWQVDATGRIGLRYPADEAFPLRLSFGELMEAALGVPANTFDAGQLRGRTVFVGNTAWFSDPINTPLGGLSGVELLALLWSALQEGNWYVGAGVGWQFAFTALGSLSLLHACWRPSGWRRWWLYALLCAALPLLLVFVIHGLALRAHWQLTLSAALLVWLGSVVLLMLHHWRSRWLALHAYLRAQLADHRRVVAMVSHELKTPLASIDLALQNLARAQNLPPEVSARHQRIRRASKTLLRLIEENLLADRLQGGAFRPGRVVLGELIANVAHNAELSALRIDNQLAAEVVFEGDQEMLRIALGNLLANAGKYAGKYAAQRPIVLRCAEQGGELVLCVIDEGPGIPADQLDRLFEPYVSLPGAQAEAPGGSGLGLALVREIILRHGGRVSVDSVEGRGSRFCLHLPLQRQP